MKNCEQTRAVFFYFAHFSLAIVKSGPINSVREIVELELVVISCLKSVTPPKVEHFLHTEESRTNFVNNGDVKSTKRFFFFLILAIHHFLFVLVGS